MANKLSTIQLLLQRRSAAKRGVSDAGMINATIKELSNDLAHIIMQWNSKLVTLLAALPDTSGLDDLDAWIDGLDGQTLFSMKDATAVSSPDYYNATQTRPKSVFEQFEHAYAALATLESDLSDQIAALSFTADQIEILDTADYFAATHVEGALEELWVLIENLVVGSLDLSAVDQDYIPVTDVVYDIGTTALRLAEVHSRELLIATKSGGVDGPNAVDEEFVISVDRTATDPGSLLIVDSAVTPRLRISTTFAPSDPVELAGFTQLEIDAMPVTNGVMLYNSDTDKFMGVEGGAWTNLNPALPEGGSGWIYFNDITPTSTGEINTKVYDDPGNDTILESCTATTENLTLHIQASYPRFKVNGIESATLLAFSATLGLYVGQEPISLPGGGVIELTTITPNSVDGASDECTVTYDAPPELLTLSFSAGYPGSQTELKPGDTFQLSGTTDVSADAIQVQDYEGSDSIQVLSFDGGAGTAFTCTVVIGDRGVAANQAIQARARKTGTTTGYGGLRTTDELGGTVDGTDVIQLNDTYPAVSIGTITYPVTQEALKDSETATVANTLSDYDSVAYTSPNSDLSITNDTSAEDPKTVTRIAGDYNVATTNFRITANRAANDATTIENAVVKITNIDATVNVINPAARLRSGGADGTTEQEHTITIISDQELLSVDMDEESTRGTFLASWAGGPSTWTRVLEVADSQLKGTYTWQNLTFTNLAGKINNVNTGDTTYVLGGFVARNITFSIPYSQSTTMGVEVVTYAKLSAGVFTATGQQSSLNGVQGNQDDLDDTYTVMSLGANPTTVWWNDAEAAGTNSSGTAQLLSIEESI